MVGGMLCHQIRQSRQNGPEPSLQAFPVESNVLLPWPGTGTMGGVGLAWQGA